MSNLVATTTINDCIKPNSESPLQTSVESENGPRLLRFETASTLDSSQEMGPLATKIDGRDVVDEDITYYAVYIPSETRLVEDNEQLHVYVDKTEALKLVKRYKKARFKAFKSREEAVEFTIHGAEIINSILSTLPADGNETLSPLVFEKPSLFKGPKAQDLVQLRKAIEAGDLQVVSSTVWSNPRYLVSSGDTPAILQEGSRYNALHVAAKARNTAMCEFIVQTVSDPAFVGLLYGDDDQDNCQERAAILFDLYLNTPDKALNETPLHFAVKFGAVGVVEALVSCPQCDRNSKNKFGQTPKEIVCSRVASPNPNLKKEITNLLEERFYVPVLRSDDNSVQPVVGTPFSPIHPLDLNTDPINPRMEIHAFAGPMTHEEAVVFRKKWKTPPRIPQKPKRSYIATPVSSSLRLRDTEKGLERVGRELAQELKVSWKEYWPFLGIFTDLSTSEGLQKLEVYLKNRFMQVYMKSPPKEASYNKQVTAEYTVTPSGSANISGVGESPVSPMSDLCVAFKACSLSDTESTPVATSRRTVTSLMSVTGSSMCTSAESDALLQVLANPGLSPFLYVEKSCQVFAKRIADGIGHLVVLEEVMRDNQSCSESVFDFLVVEVKHLQVLVNSYMDDPRFVSVDFHLVHSRIATLAAAKIKKLSSWDVELIISCLRLALLAHQGIEPASSDEDEIPALNTMYRTRKQTERRKKSDTSIQNHVRCLAQNIIGALNQLEGSEVEETEARVDTEDECMNVWADAIVCTCNWHMQNFSRNSRKGSFLKRTHCMKSIVTIADNGRCSDKAGTANCFARHFDFSDCNDSSNILELTVRDVSLSGGRIENKDCKSSPGDASDTDEASESDADDAFYTPPTSPEEASSEEEMVTADEGIGVYIEGEAPSKMDLAVLQAMENCRITPGEYPNVYRWHHLVMLHSEKERNSWASPAALRRQQRARTQSVSTTQSSSSRSFRNSRDPSSPQAWHRIAGRYAPVRFND